MPGVQTLLPVMLNHVNAGKLSLERLVDLWSYGPERVHRLVKKGRIKEGYHADFTVIDLKRENIITNAQQKSKTGWTPFDGVKVKGWPVMTIIRGHRSAKKISKCNLIPLETFCQSSQNVIDCFRNV